MGKRSGRRRDTGEIHTGARMVVQLGVGRVGRKNRKRARLIIHEIRCNIYSSNVNPQSSSLSSSPHLTLSPLMPPRGSTRLAQGAARAPATVPASTPNRAVLPAAAGEADGGWDDSDNGDLDDSDDGGLDDSDVKDPLERIIKAFMTVHGEVRTRTKAKNRSLTLTLGDVSSHIQKQRRTPELRHTLAVWEQVSRILLSILASTLTIFLGSRRLRPSTGGVS
jgi:hypothetical protein